MFYIVSLLDLWECTMPGARVNPHRRNCRGWQFHAPYPPCATEALLNRGVQWMHYKNEHPTLNECVSKVTQQELSKHCADYVLKPGNALLNQHL